MDYTSDGVSPGGGARYFDTGATRDSKAGKLAYTGFLSPAVLRRYAEYMHKHRLQSDGTLRDPDNWKKGMPPAEYLESMGRHFMDAWLESEGWPTPDGNLEDSLCAIMFNAMGWLHVVLEQRARDQGPPSVTSHQDSVASATISGSRRAE